MPLHHAAHIAPHAAVDSAATDTTDTVAHAIVKPFVPAYTSGFPQLVGNNLKIAKLEQLPVMSIPTGDKALPIENTPIHNPGIMGLVFLIFFFIAVSYKKGHKYVSNFVHNMFSVRKRQNVFDDHTVSETQIMTALIANTCLMEGILLYLGISFQFPGLQLAAHLFLAVAMLVGVALGFYLLQLLLYYLIGYTFADTVDTKLWIDGFKATQSILGLGLFPIIFIILLYPDTFQMMLVCAITLYFLARLVFISKGLRIFFNNLTSTIYFILYLCAVEIVPVILALLGAISLCGLLQS